MKRLLLAVLFCLILAGCIWKLGIVLRPTDPDYCECQIRSFHSRKENSLDVIAYGSSHGWNAFDALLYQESTGLQSYNYGCHWQRFNTTWLFFKDSLYTQSPKVVYVETGRVNLVAIDDELGGEIYYTRKLPQSVEKKKYLNQCFGPVKDNYEKYLSYYIPFILDHSNWENIDKKSFHYKKSSTGGLEKVNGFNIVKGVEEQEICFEVHQKSLPRESIELLDDIVKTCKERNIGLIFYTVPVSEGFEYEDAMKEYATNKGCEYISFYEHFSEVGLNPKTDFYDGHHVNQNGAEKITKYLISVAK